MKTKYSKDIRYLSALILVIFIIGTMASLSLIPSFALSPFEDDAYLLEDSDRIALYLDESNVFESKEAKLETMSERVTVGDYTIYVETTTGEVAVKNNLTGQILTTNPYDVATANEARKATLMNQISLTYCNIKDNKETTFGSFNDAALRKQITVKNIKNGIRVEYTLGREASKQLLPGWVEKDRFEQNIYTPIYNNCFTDADLEEYNSKNPDNPTTLDEMRAVRYNRLIGSNYTFIDYDDPNNSEAYKARILKEYPCIGTKYKDYDGDGTVDHMKIYAIVKNLAERSKNSIESAVKQYSSYTYEDLQEDTDLTGYPGENSNPALFRLALEYTLSENGLEVRLPANSIRFDEDNYRLISVQVLPYFGASSNDYTGYTFIPDGSGAIIRNEDIIADGKNQYTIKGQVYGNDFAYHELADKNHGQTMHLPVFGVVEDTIMTTINRENQTGYVWLSEGVVDDNGKVVYYTSSDRIMLDATDSKGNLITTVEDYLAQYKYDMTATTPTVIKVGSDLWSSPVYATIDTLEMYNTFVEANVVPYIEVITHYLMAPVLDEDGKEVTYDGNTVYQYVDEEGNPVDEENKVEGVIKIKEQLWYNGAPAYYQSDVPKDPVAVTPPAADGDGEDDGTGEDAGDAGDAGDGAGDGEEGEGEDGEEGEEEVVEIERYNDIQKVEESYDNIAYEEIESVVSQGYFAIITEGDALTNITTAHGGVNPEVGIGEHKYNSVFITVFPRPQDSYRLADAISVSNDSAEWVVVSDRKYTGSYRVQYSMISDATYITQDDTGASKEESFEYEASYVGMANIYRDYLIENGVLTELTYVDDDIPLYLEAFGMTTATKTVATIPMVVDIALTSFENLEEIYENLEKEGIDNINFKLTGFNKGGLYSYAPSALKFESVVGGNSGYEKMVDYCSDISAQANKHLAIYPDFDFANVESTGMFDGFSSLKDSARTIDDRYASKREYDATYQSFQYLGSIVVSPSVFMKLFNKFAKKLDKLGVSGVSVSSLGTDLNSDFDSDDAYNREDSKFYTIQLLEKMTEKYGKVMIDGGNAYALKYAAHILNMPLDSSRFDRTSASIPFMGMVLHGYVNYAGTATGMASDIDREILKMIENGASPYFTIAYDNTSYLKDDYSFSDYYSIDYEICRSEIIEKYNIVNGALADVQTATITDHGFLTGTRSLGENEMRVVTALMEEGRANLAEAIAQAQKEYNDRKTLAERHGEEFTEVFEETYAYLASADLYAQHIYDEFAAAIDREIKGSNIVRVEYTRKDGTTKTFILNYEVYEVTVEYEGNSYVIQPNGFIVVGQ